MNESLLQPSLKTSKRKLNDKLPISLVVITANEERNLERCLEAANFCVEMIIVDSGSTDRTMEIAQRYGARIIQRRWAGYRDQKNFACALATQPWVLCIDADEVVTPTLRKSIESAFQSEPVVDGFELNRHGVFGTTPINHSGWYPQWRMFLYRRGQAEWTGNEPHPYVQFNGRCSERLAGDLLHFTCVDTRQHIIKNVNSAYAAALAMYQNGDKSTFSQIVLHPLWAAFRVYVLKRGFVNGFHGWVIALSTGFYTFLKYAMLREMKMADRTKNSQTGH